MGAQTWTKQYTEYLTGMFRDGDFDPTDLGKDNISMCYQEFLDNGPGERDERAKNTQTKFRTHYKDKGLAFMMANNHMNSGRSSRTGKFLVTIKFCLTTINCLTPIIHLISHLSSCKYFLCPYV